MFTLLSLDNKYSTQFIFPLFSAAPNVSLNISIFLILKDYPLVRRKC